MTKAISPTLRLVLALIVGIVMAAATLSIQKSTSVPAIYYLKRIVIALILPGLLSAIAIAGNVHTFVLWPAAVVNGILYFIVAWLILRLIWQGRKTS